MVEMSSNGKIQGFDKSEKELETLIKSYVDGVNDGTYINPCPPQFYAVIGVDRDIVAAVIRAGNEPESAWKKRGLMFKSALQWLRGEMASEVHWQGNKSIKTMFLLKQDWGDGIALEDKPDPKSKRGNKGFTVSWGSPSTEDKTKKSKR